MNERISQQQISDAKAADLVTLIGSHVKLTRRGRAWWGCCPFHKEKTPSFKVEGEFYKCFGCGAGGDAISWVRESRNLGFTQAVEYLTGKERPAYFCGIRIRHTEREDDDAKRRARAQEIWEAAGPLRGSLAEIYLSARGIRVANSTELRFMASAEHSESGNSLPALAARLSDEDGFCAVQRTFLSPDGRNKAAVNPNKKTLGPMGSGAVRLREPGDVLGLAEGIETALSAAHLYQIATWATLSANRLASIAIPETVRNIIIFADQGEVGMREALKASNTYEARGIGVEIIAPAADFPDANASDFNDVLRSVAA